LSSVEIFTVQGRLIQKPGLCAGEESTSRNALSKQLTLIYAHCIRQVHMAVIVFCFTLQETINLMVDTHPTDPSQQIHGSTNTCLPMSGGFFVEVGLRTEKAG